MVKPQHNVAHGVTSLSLLGATSTPRVSREYARACSVICLPCSSEKCPQLRLPFILSILSLFGSIFYPAYTYIAFILFFTRFGFILDHRLKWPYPQVRPTPEGPAIDDWDAPRRSAPPRPRRIGWAVESPYDPPPAAPPSSGVRRVRAPVSVAVRAVATVGVCGVLVLCVPVSLRSISHPRSLGLGRGKRGQCVAVRSVPANIWPLLGIPAVIFSVSIFIRRWRFKFRIEGFPGGHVLLSTCYMVQMYRRGGGSTERNGSPILAK